ncbi:hypothetical protein [Nostoc sp.]
MLETTSKTVKDSFFISFDDLDDNSLSELSSNEASEITGGFTITNLTGATRAFYIFGPGAPTAETLVPNGIGTYNASYILFSSSQTQLQPALSSQLGPTDTVNFTQDPSGNVSIVPALSGAGPGLHLDSLQLGG